MLNAFGKTTVVISKESTREIVFAAKELAYYLSKVKGVEIPVKVAPVSEKNIKIHVGINSSIKNIPDISKCIYDGYWLVSQPNGDLLITGKNSSGTISGIYGFLQDYCGIRFFLPGQEGTFIPFNKEFVIPKLNSLNNPAFFSRLFYGSSGYDALWRKHNRIVCSIQVRHMIGNFLKPSQYGKEHPEYFPYSKAKRKRIVPPKDTLRRWQPCFSNPEVIAQVSKNIIKFFEENPDKKIVPLGVNDGGGFCECPNCSKINAGSELNSLGVKDQAPVYYTFVNSVAERVAKKYPDKYISIMSYSYVRDIPTGMKLKKNIIVSFVNNFITYFDPEDRKDLVRTLNISKSAPAFAGTYCYFYGNGYLIPVLPFNILETYLDTLYENNFRFYNGEHSPLWNIDGIKYYILARKLWDPSLRYKDLLKDFTDKMFGSGSREMLKYYELCQKKWETQKVHLPNKYHILNSYSEQAALFDKAFCIELLKHLKHAQEQVTGTKGKILLNRKIKYITFLRDFASLNELYSKSELPEELAKLCDYCIQLQILHKKVFTQFDALRKLNSFRVRYDFRDSLTPEMIAWPLLKASRQKGDMSEWKRFLAVAGDEQGVKWLDKNQDNILNSKNLFNSHNVFTTCRHKPGDNFGNNAWRYAAWVFSEGCKGESVDIKGHKWGKLSGFDRRFMYTPFCVWRRSVKLQKGKTYMLLFDYFADSVLKLDTRISASREVIRPLLTFHPKTGIAFCNLSKNINSDFYLGMEGIGNAWYGNTELKIVPDKKRLFYKEILPELPRIPVLPEPLQVELPSALKIYAPKVGEGSDFSPIFLRLIKSKTVLSATHELSGVYNLRIKIKSKDTKPITKATYYFYGSNKPSRAKRVALVNKKDYWEGLLKIPSTAIKARIFFYDKNEEISWLEFKPEYKQE